MAALILTLQVLCMWFHTARLVAADRKPQGSSGLQVASAWWQPLATSAGRLPASKQASLILIWPGEPASPLSPALAAPQASTRPGGGEELAVKLFIAATASATENGNSAR